MSQKINVSEKEQKEETEFYNEYKDGTIYCPICERKIYFASDYLLEIFSDNKFGYISAVLVTHYRHHHIKYYDRSWQNWSYAEKNKEYSTMSHKEYKIIVNNRSKRQIIRNIVKDSKLNKSLKKELIKGFIFLQNNDKKVSELIKKSLLNLEMEDYKCYFCNNRAKFIVSYNSEKINVCGIHKRKKEFKKSNNIKLKNVIKKEITKFLQTN